MKKHSFGSSDYPPQHGLLELMMAEIRELKTSVSEIPRLRTRIDYLEKMHSEEENRKHKRRGWNHEPDPFDEDCCSKADSLDKQYAEERRNRI